MLVKLHLEQPEKQETSLFWAQLSDQDRYNLEKFYSGWNPTHKINRDDFDLASTWFPKDMKCGLEIGCKDGVTIWAGRKKNMNIFGVDCQSYRG